MFGFFKGKARKPQEAEQVEYETAPGTEIRYSPTLVDELKNEHQKLFASYVSIKTHFERNDFASVSQLLNDFRFDLHNHLINENVRLYIYLSRITSHDQETFAMVRKFRQEMEGIGKTALRLLKKYEALDIDQELSEAFAKDFAAIGAILTERVKNEEDVLYPLYKSCH
ncbi:MAG: hemerythrin domain-containing protein [Thiohalomonadaceae bacterium]